MNKRLFLLFIGLVSTSFLLAQSDTTITLKAITGLQYDLPRFALKPNQKVTLLFKNEDDMAHNVVFVQPNKRLEVVELALKLAEKGADLSYVPKSAAVLVASKILIPNSSETLVFVAPAQEGLYPYVCTYPGHGYVMYGAMYVTTKPLPPLEKDKNIPPSRQTEAISHQHTAPSPHPFALEYPLLYRTFMPSCGPAAFAVALSPTHSYCFDAGKCTLRYVWTGGFVDNNEHWKGNGNALAKVLGEVYFREKTLHLFQTKKTDELPVVQFKGYSLSKRVPTFHYLIDEIEVSETIALLPKDAGIVRTFVFKKPLSERITFGDLSYNAPNVVVMVNGKAAQSSDKFGIGLSKGTKQFSVVIKKPNVAPTPH